MTSLLLRSIPTHLRVIAPAALLAAAATLGGSAVGDPAIACAEPREWDIGAFDQCIEAADDAWANDPTINHDELAYHCCKSTGGDWDEARKSCVAPPADAEAQPTQPGVAPRPGVAEQPAEPAPPPFPIIQNPEVTQTFVTPTPIG